MHVVSLPAQVIPFMVFFSPLRNAEPCAIPDKHPVLQTSASVYPCRGLARLTVTFKVPADLSQWTQVLFLTHHEYLLDVSEASIGAGAHQAHDLST